MDLLEAAQNEAVAAETLGNSQQLVELSTAFAQTGQGLQADADRAQTDLSVRESEARRAAENTRVASIRLARLLSHDPTQTLVPREPALAPIDLVAAGAALPELLAIGLSNRPELAESQSLLEEAITFRFAHKYLARNDRTIDQMIQSARSGKKNILEGSKAGLTSKETQIKLTNVARASLEELLDDYRDYLRARDLRMWDKDSKEALYVRKLGRQTPQT